MLIQPYTRRFTAIFTVQPKTGYKPEELQTILTVNIWAESPEDARMFIEETSGQFDYKIVSDIQIQEIENG